MELFECENNGICRGAKHGHNFCAEGRSPENAAMMGWRRVSRPSVAKCAAAATRVIYHNVRRSFQPLLARCHYVNKPQTIHLTVARTGKIIITRTKNLVLVPYGFIRAKKSVTDIYLLPPLLSINTVCI